MSRHIVRGSGHTLVLGLDAPLRCFFGQVRTAHGQVILGHGREYDATPAGLTALLADAAEYEEVPPTVADALERDLADLANGRELSYEKSHPGD